MGFYRCLEKRRKKKGKRRKKKERVFTERWLGSLRCMWCCFPSSLTLHTHVRGVNLPLSPAAKREKIPLLPFSVLSAGKSEGKCMMLGEREFEVE